MLDKIGKILYKYNINYEKRNNYKGGINMANIEEVSGVFGGVTVNNEQNVGEDINVNSTITNATTGVNLPAKTGFWNKVKSVLFYEVKVELTPYQQKIEDEINDFLYQEITWAKVKDFLFQEVTFGKKKD